MVMRAGMPARTLQRMPGTAPRIKPLVKASIVIISVMGTAKPTVEAKKMRISHRMIRFSCVPQTWCERGTLTKHMPATKAPSRWDPINDPIHA